MTTQADLDRLISRVRNTPGMQVTERSSTWIVRNTENPDTEPVIINRAVAKTTDSLTPAKEALKRAGWNEDDFVSTRRFDTKAVAAQTKTTDPPDTEWDRALEYARLTANSFVMDAPNGVRYRKAVIRITGALAYELLKFNKFFEKREPNDPIGKTNRPFTPFLAEQFEKDMLAGHWMVSHQGLAWDYNGVLLDGQHRLVAVYNAWTEDPSFEGIVTEVTYDLDPETFKIIDVGRTRRPTDILGIRGEDNRMHLASALRLLYWYETKREGIFHFNRTKMTSTELLEMLDKHPGIREAVRRAYALRDMLIVSAVAVAIYLIEREHDAPRLDEFIHGVKTGAELPDLDARLALRNWAMKSRLRKRSFNTEQLALFLKAWNDWITNTPRKEVKIRNTETFPVPVAFKNPTPEKVEQ